VRFLVLLALAHVGCYSKHDYACEISCAVGTGAAACPAGLTCNSDGLCNTSEASCRAGDAALDSTIADAPPGTSCFGKGYFRVCIPSDGLPTTDITIGPGPGIHDTNVAASCKRVAQAAGFPDVCVIIARNYTIVPNTIVSVEGELPLAILATQTLQIDGTLDVSTTSGRIGPGAILAELTPRLCRVALPGNSTSIAGDGAGGSAGGGMGFPGGPGGTGFGNNLGAEMTMAAPVMMDRAVRGGCRGARGGEALGEPGGVGGIGGGAVYLIAGSQIIVNGAINASGAGGQAATISTGGGGGGSGGFIGLDAPAYMIANTARIFASGGSGSQGGGMTSPGAAGVVATAAMTEPTTPNTAQGGGIGAQGHSSAPGGAGGLGATAAGGGGGGGGGGFIGTYGNFTTATGAIVRPPRTAM
jgi:hypothetical protein